MKTEAIMTLTFYLMSYMTLNNVMYDDIVRCKHVLQ